MDGAPPADSNRHNRYQSPTHPAQSTRKHLAAMHYALFRALTDLTVAA